MTYMQAALTILTYADRPLTLGEITAVAVAQGLVHPRGRTPDRTMASVLYRRMAADPDAPIISRGARFWLRGRPLPAAESTYLAQQARRIRVARRHAPGATRGASTIRPATRLPAPPLRLPDEVVQAATASRGRASDYAPTRRERAVARAGERAAGLLARLAERRAAGAEWDAAATATRLVAPLLRHLGYHQGTAITPIERPGRGVSAYLLHAGGAPAIALDVRRLMHDLGDDDAWRALDHARQAGVPYAAATNGREVRVYSVAMAEAQDGPAAAPILVLDLTPVPADGDAHAEQAAALWLLSRAAVAAGALDAYAANRAVGAALLDALDAPDSALARALVAEVRARVGVVLPANLVLRHARLALRGRRGRDGEPLPEDIATVGAVRGPRLERAGPPLPRARGAGAEVPQSA